MTRLLAESSRNRGLVSDRGKKFLLFVKHPYWLFSPPSPIFNWYSGFFPRERSGLGVKLATDFNVKVRLRVEFSCTCTSFRCLYGVHRDNFTSAIYTYDLK